MPTSLRSFDELDLTNDRNTLAHLRTSEDPTTRQRQYVHMIDMAIAEVVDSSTLLIVAAAEPLAGLFTELSRHERLAHPGLIGNADERTPDELAGAATVVIARERAAQRDHELARLAEFPDRDLVVDEPARVLAASRHGAIDTLFVDLDRWDDGDLIEDAARSAHDGGARIVAAPESLLEGHGGIAAILRYPVDATAR